ncbi:hypothetical protein BDC45DRAFT_525825 [Circinella umbellata]|nr:hypothetical protein BDC45DRAFT_525825 [Circinella umbellata]
MSLTKAQSVFVGCTTTHAQPSVETTITTTEADVEPSLRQLSFEWTRSARSSITSSHSRPTFIWEPNEQASECRRCGRWFNLIVRRHHCRRCGLVVCDKCSNRVMLLPFSHIVVDPALPLEQHYLVSLQPQRVCDGCYEELSRPRGSFSSSNNHHNTATSVIPNSNSISNSRSSSIRMQRSPSAQSIMMECPVCGKDLDEYDGSTNEQELHVQTCLNANTPVALSGIRYVVYKLPSNSALMGQECVICLEEFVEGNTMARLNCFCTFHHACINSWFAKGKECPLHSQ